MRYDGRPSVDATDGNIFVLVGRARGAMRRAGIASSEIDDMCKRVSRAESYHEALHVLMDYVSLSLVRREG